MKSLFQNDTHKTEYDKDESMLYKAFFAAVIFGFGLVLVYDGFHNFDGVPVALLWSLACVASGGITGFLFGVPRVIPYEAEVQQGAANNTVTNQNNSRLSVNTNIEQISDWLTKIIVGLGLVHLGEISTYLDNSASTLAKALGSYGEGPHAFSLALIVYFSIVGFISGYLLTRLYISRLIITADNQVATGYEKGVISYSSVQVPNELKNVVSETELKNILAQSPIGPTSNRQPDEKVTVTSRKLSDIKEEQLKDPVSLAAWATAQLNLGNINKALDGYRTAINTFKNDAKLRYQYALTLHGIKHHKDSIKELEKANTLVKDNGDKVLQADIITALTFVYLYVDPPKGFEKSIEHGEKYVSNPTLPPNSWIWINLAAAYGQQAAYKKSYPEYPIPYSEIRNKAFNAMQQALVLDKSSAATFKILLQRDITKPKEENDLEVFEVDNEFRNLLGLQPISTHS